MADQLAEIFLSLYSDGNKDEWKQKDMEGLSAFLNEDFRCTWNGFSVWDEGNGYARRRHAARLRIPETGHKEFAAEPCAPDLRRHVALAQ